MITRAKLYILDRLRYFLLDTLPKNGVAAEIGVYKGDFSKKIIDRTNPKKLYLIDPWKYETDDIYNSSLYGGSKGKDQKNLDTMYADVYGRFIDEIRNGKVEIIRSYSDEAATLIDNNSLDWVYIDGNHRYEFVKEDLELYYNKVKKGGYITGDDYRKGGWWQGGVKKAVDEFISLNTCELIKIKNHQYILKKYST